MFLLRMHLYHDIFAVACCIMIVLQGGVSSMHAEPLFHQWDDRRISTHAGQQRVYIYRNTLTDRGLISRVVGKEMPDGTIVPLDTSSTAIVDDDPNLIIEFSDSEDESEKHEETPSHQESLPDDAEDIKIRERLEELEKIWKYYIRDGRLATPDINEPSISRAESSETRDSVESSSPEIPLDDLDLNARQQMNPVADETTSGDAGDIAFDDADESEEFHDASDNIAESETDETNATEFFDCLVIGEKSEVCEKKPKSRQKKRLKQKSNARAAPPSIKEVHPEVVLPEVKQLSTQSLMCTFGEYCIVPVRYCVGGMCSFIDRCTRLTSNMIQSVLSLKWRRRRGRKRRHAQSTKYYWEPSSREEEQEPAEPAVIPRPRKMSLGAEDIERKYKTFHDKILRNIEILRKAIRGVDTTNGIKLATEQFICFVSGIKSYMKIAAMLPEKERVYLMHLVQEPSRDAELLAARYFYSNAMSPRINEPHYIPRSFPNEYLPDLKECLIRHRFVKPNARFVIMHQ